MDVTDTLLAWFRLYVEGPQLVAQRLNGCPVLLYQPPEPKDEEDYRLKTMSGVVRVTVGGAEPLAAIVRKHAENVFQERITIGRTRNNDIVLDDPSVSRFHAWVDRAESTSWRLTDAGSRNGSHVSGQRLVPKAPVPLIEGADVKIGGIMLTFMLPQAFLALLKRRAHGLP